jgi:hypothetical protein
MGLLDMVRCADDLSPTLLPPVDTALGGLSQAADHLAQLQRLRQVEIRSGPLGPRLDLSRSTAWRPVSRDVRDAVRRGPSSPRA